MFKTIAEMTARRQVLDERTSTLRQEIQEFYEQQAEFDQKYGFAVIQESAGNTVEITSRIRFSQEMVEDIRECNGVANCNLVNPYTLLLQKATVFGWDEVLDSFSDVYESIVNSFCAAENADAQENTREQSGSIPGHQGEKAANSAESREAVQQGA